MYYKLFLIFLLTIHGWSPQDFKVLGSIFYVLMLVLGAIKQGCYIDNKSERSSEIDMIGRKKK